VRKDIDTTYITIDNSLHTPVPVALTKEATFFIIRGDIEFKTALDRGITSNVVYTNESVTIQDSRETFTRVIKITVNETTPDTEPHAFDFYGGDLILIEEFDAPALSAYVFLPYINLFYLVAFSETETINKWSTMSNTFRCISAIHKLCSQLLLISKCTPEETVMQELRNLQKLANVWTTPTNTDEFDWEIEAKKLLDNKVVPKIKKFAVVNNNYRRIRLD